MIETNFQRISLFLKNTEAKYKVRPSSKPLIKDGYESISDPEDLRDSKTEVDYNTKKYFIRYDGGEGLFQTETLFKAVLVSNDDSKERHFEIVFN